MLILTFHPTEQAIINENNIMTFAGCNRDNKIRILVYGPDANFNQLMRMGETATIKSLDLSITLLAWHSMTLLRMGFEAPDNIIILREKVYLKDRQKRMAA